MKKYSQYKNTIFLGIDENQQINEGIFNYVSKLIKKFNAKTIDKNTANAAQHDFAMIIAESITNLKFKTFNLYSIIFNLKDVLNLIKNELVDQIAKDKETYNGVILKSDYMNGENFIIALERTTYRIKTFIKDAALKYITLKYPVSKISSNYTDNKKIVEKFIKNFNIIFEPYKKSTWLFSKKIKDLSPYEMLINDVVKAYGKEFFKVEQAVIRDDSISSSIGVNTNYSSDSMDPNKIDLNLIPEDFKVELTEIEKNYYKHIFDGNRLAIIQKDFKDQNKLYGDEYNTPEFFQIIKNLSELGFKIVFNEKFKNVPYHKLTYSMVERNIRNKNIVFAMTTAYSKKTAGGNVFNRDNDIFDDSNTSNDIPEGHEPEFIKYLNKYFGIKKRASLINLYSKEYNVQFPDSMFKITHKLAIQAFRKYVYVYEKNPEDTLDTELLIEIFNQEYKNYLKSSKSEEYVKNTKIPDEKEIRADA